MALQGLEGRRVLVTGAANGIGLAAARRFIEEGCKVALVDLEGPALETLGAESEANARVFVADVRDEDAVSAAVQEAARWAGGLDVVIANAAVEPADDDRAHELQLSVWRRAIDTNLTGCFLTCKHGLRALLQTESANRSVIVTVSPTGIRGSAPAQEAYSASKAGTIGLMRVMARDYAADGIRVNAVMPGFIDTRANASLIADPVALSAALQLIPMGRVGRPEEVAATMAWLSSDDAAYATGAIFTVDGGQTAV